MVEPESAEPGRTDPVDQVRVSPPGLGDPMAVLEHLSDPGCRAILAATGRPRTAAELCDICDMPTSTAYRKLEALSDAALLEETCRLRDNGTHPVQYHRAVDQVEIAFDGRAGRAIVIGAAREVSGD